MRQFRCFDELRSTTPSFDGEVVYLTSWNDDGSFVGYGKFAGYLSAGTDNGITISSNGGAFHWKRICYDFLTPFDMGLAPNAEDATSTIQSLIDFVEANGVLIAGNGCGRIILPDGYIYRITDELKLSVPMDFFSFGAIHYDMSSGLAISVGQDAGWSNGYDIRIRNYIQMEVKIRHLLMHQAHQQCKYETWYSVILNYCHVMDLETLPLI